MLPIEVVNPSSAGMFNSTKPSSCLQFNYVNSSKCTDEMQSYTDHINCSEKVRTSYHSFSYILTRLVVILPRIIRSANGSMQYTMTLVYEY